ncbi:MAG: 50S ribosomal protein L22 [candidate division Zixibacteria bacterium]|nr:50S ribosomal protein L22 [candidate division Zixibacteria bacterium]
MQGHAQAKFCRGSARKMRRVAALVRGLPVDRATAMLRLLPKQAAEPLGKVIASATANALSVEGTAHHKQQDFVVVDVRVDGGPIARRFRATGMGRAYRIRKRFCHVKVVVTDEKSQGAPRVSAAPAKA